MLNRYCNNNISLFRMCVIYWFCCVPYYCRSYRNEIIIRVISAHLVVLHCNNNNNLIFALCWGVDNINIARSNRTRRAHSHTRTHNPQSRVLRRCCRLRPTTTCPPTIPPPRPSSTTFEPDASGGSGGGGSEAFYKRQCLHAGTRWPRRRRVAVMAGPESTWVCGAVLPPRPAHPRPPGEFQPSALLAFLRYNIIIAVAVVVVFVWYWTYTARRRPLFFSSVYVRRAAHPNPLQILYIVCRQVLMWCFHRLDPNKF